MASSSGSGTGGDIELKQLKSTAATTAGMLAKKDETSQDDSGSGSSFEQEDISAINRLRAVRMKLFATLPSGSPLATGNTTGHTKAIAACALAADQKWLATASRDSTVRIWNTANGKPLDAAASVYAAILKGVHREGLDSVAISSDGTKIASAGWDLQVVVWDVETGAQLAKLDGIAAKVTMASLHFSPPILEHKHKALVVTDTARDDSLDPSGIDSAAESRQAPGGFLLAASSDARENVFALFSVKSGKQIRTFEGHTSLVHMCRFSPSGRHAVSASKDASLRVWSVATGRCLSVLTGHSAPVVYCTWAPSLYRPIIASASLDGVVCMWNAKNGAPVRSFYGHSSVGQRVTCEFSPDCSQLVSAASNGSVFLWDANSGARIRHLNMTSHALIPVNAAPSALAPGGASSSSPSSTSPPLSPQLGPSESPFASSAGGSASSQPTTHVSGAAALGNLLFCQFSLDGQRILASYATEDFGLRLIDSQIEPVPLIHKHPKSSSCCAFSPDGKKIVSSSSLGPVHIWDASTSRTLVELAGHTHTVKSCSFSPATGDIVVTGSWDKTMKLWDPVSGSCLATSPEQGPLNSCAFSHGKDALIVSASGDGFVRIWRYAYKKAAQPPFSAISASLELAATLAGHNGAVNYATFSPDGSLIVSCGFDRSVRVWATANVLASSGGNGCAPLVVLQDHTGSVLSCAFSPDGSRLVTNSIDKSIKVWNVHALAPSTASNTASSGGAAAGNRFSATAGSSTPSTPFGASGNSIGIYALTPSPSGSAGSVVAPMTTPLVTLHQAHLNAVTCSVFSPSGARLISVGRDKTLKVWNLLSSPVACEMAFRLTSEAECVSAAPTGSSVSSAYQDILLHRVVVAAVAMHDATVAVMDVSKSDPPTTSMELLIERNDLESLRRITHEFPHTINVPFLDGRKTVVHRAAEKGSNDLMEVLLSAAVPFLLVLDADGRSAIDIALARNFKTIAQLLTRRLCAPPFGIHPSNSFPLTKLLPRLIRKYPDIATELIQQLDFVSAPALAASKLAFSPAFPHSYIEFAKRERPYALLQSLSAHGIGSVGGPSLDSISGSGAPTAAGALQVDSSTVAAVSKVLDDLQPPLTGAIDDGERLVRASPFMNDTISVWSDLVAQHEETNKFANLTSDRSQVAAATAASSAAGQADTSAADHEDLDDETLARMHDDSLWQDVRVPVSLCVVPLPYILGFDTSAQDRVLPPLQVLDRDAASRRSTAVSDIDVSAGTGAGTSPAPAAAALEAPPSKVKIGALQRISSTLSGTTDLQFYDPSSLDAYNPQSFHKVNKAALRETFLHAAVRSKHKDLFRTGIMKAVMDYKWQAFGKRKFLGWLLWYTCFVVLYTIVTALAVTRNVTCQSYPYILNNGDSVNYTTTGDWVLFGFEMLTLAIDVYLVLYNLFRLFKERTLWFMSIWNIVEMAGALLVIAIVPLRLTCQEAEAGVVAVAGLLLWFRLVSFARAFEKAGILVFALSRIIQDIVFFLMLLVLLVLSFAHAFFVLFGGQDSTGFETWSTSSISVYRILLGDTNYDNFSLSITPPLAKIIWGIFTAVMSVILLNVLIALLSDSYQLVKDNAEVEWRISLAAIIAEFEMAMTPRERAKHSPKWIHYIVPSHVIPRGVEGDFAGGSAKGSDDVNRAVKLLGEKVTDVDTRLTDLLAKLDRIESLLVANAAQNR